MTVNFSVDGDPFGKQRPRHTKGGHTYTPNETREHEQLIAWAYRQQCGNIRLPDNAQIHLHVIAYFAIPKRATKAQRERMISGEIRPTVKPDWDNIGKLVADALNGVAYDDDKCIVQATVEKVYDEIPHTTITIREV